MANTRNHNYWKNSFPETMAALAALLERIEDASGVEPNHWDDEEAAMMAANYADDLTDGDRAPDSDSVLATIIDYELAQKVK